jgi:hypothetical protein
VQPRYLLPALCFFLVIFSSCSNAGDAPDVSGVKVNMQTARFEKDFFAMDTNKLDNSLLLLRQRYPNFTPLFIGGVLGLPDSVDLVKKEVSRFMAVNRFMYDSVEEKFSDLSSTESAFKKAFQYTLHYFPNYAVPQIVTCVGPVDAMATMQDGDKSPDFLAPGMLGISLQFYLGKSFFIYQARYFIDNVAPLYRSRRFEKNYIVPDAMKLIVDDIFPDKSNGKPLIEQIIERGKQWWLLDKFLPGTPDSLKTGYTQAQLDWVKENEGNIWQEILSDAPDLYTSDPTTIQTFIGEGPTTQGMPPASPGNIGPWVGRQIVRQFVSKNSSLTPTQVMNTPAAKILEGAKYRPK